MSKLKFNLCKIVARAILFSVFAASAFAEEFVAPETVVIAPGSFEYLASGEYLRDNYPVDAPVLKLSFSEPLEIMKF